MFESNHRLGMTVVLAIILFAFVLGSLSGCTLRTRQGVEYKILEKDDTPEKPDSSESATDSATPAQDTEFAELTRAEKDELAMTSLDPDIEPVTDIEPPEDLTPDEERPGDSMPTRIKQNPKSELPLETRLHPVPASAEVLAFDPSRRVGTNQKAALALTEKGRQALATGKIELAISKFQNAISVDSKCGHAYFYFARARFEQNDWDQVVALADKGALHLSKDTVFLSRAQLLKAQALANQKRYLPALAACESAIDADATNVQAKLLRSRIRSLF